MTDHLTPRQIVAELDKFIVGQAKAKRAVAVALRNRYRRSRLAEEMRDEVIPKNILMIGPTGVGKTEIARRLAKLARAPFLKIEATKFTEVGYVGRDVDSMVRDLIQVSIRLVEAEKMEAVQDQANEAAIDHIVDILQPRRRPPGTRSSRSAQDQFAELQKQLGNLFSTSPSGTGASPGNTPPPQPEPTPQDDEYERKRTEQEDRIRQRLREQVAIGARDEDEIEIEVEESSSGPTIIPFFGGPGGSNEEMGGNLQEMLGQMMPRKKKQRKVTIREARKILAAEAARGLIDQEAVTRDAVRRAEETGIIFLDEMDKIAGRGGQFSGADVSREGVQRDLLPIIEGSTVQTRYGPVSTNHILFIAAGAFHVSKPSDLIPELQGRLPIRVELDSLNEADFRRILTEPKNALTRQYVELLATEGVTITFTEDGIQEIARIAVDVNTRTENIGARRLQTIMERVLEDLAFEAPDVEEKSVVINAAFVRERLAEIVKDDELSRYIL